ncbi:hypothetical protein HYDPIDRAFT_188300 [Hydnomerulius pinastri MD-312]|uniref:Carrier domain-containing protein n=1 Tax=Hydnomerulius pinastri MD-312 TaxID=994086 RepID=A0A0C9VYL9_9AGAM|nr:hypothetical protein HYDPIDRAFT_188300 [Hydnomerulius pinastri MD-312]
MAAVWACMLAGYVPCLQPALNAQQEHKEGHVVHISGLLSSTIWLTNDSGAEQIKSSAGLDVHLFSELKASTETLGTKFTANQPRPDDEAILFLTSGSTDNFFELGATSLDVIRLKSEGEATFGLPEIPTIQIFKHPDISSLANYINSLVSNNTTREYDPIVPLQLTGSKTPIFVVHPGIGEVLLYISLAKYFQNEHPFYALRARGFEPGQPFFESMDEMVSSYVVAVKRTQPHGPYAIAGYSFGGFIAFELSKRLEALGNEVRFTGIIDIPAHIPDQRRRPDWTRIMLNISYFFSLLSKQEADALVPSLRLLTRKEQMDGPLLAEAVCEYFNYSTTCYDEYSVLALGSVFTQVVALADVGGYDGQNICSGFSSLCPIPPTVPLNLTDWFAKPKPNPLPPPKQPSGERLKVLHVSDIHIDPRYATGSEANCSAYMCCRDNVYNADSPDQIVLPASRYGAYYCDTPLSLMVSAMEAVAPLTGTEETGFDFSIFTGDLTAHDNDNQYSRAYVEYAEVMVYNLLKKFLGPAPVYATVGNHDTYIQFQMIPYALGGYLGSQFNWLYEHISSMWNYEGWLPEESVEFARTHYAAYTVKRPDGLRIISLDTDICNRSNYFSYINSTDPDPFGILRFLTDELQDAEDAGDRVWIVGHVLSGWDGTAAQYNPTNLFYQIVDRYSPHVIANIFWGHTHEDELSIFYANNATIISADTALAVSWIGPSLTPLTNLNSGFRMYEVDSATFDILDAYTWMSAVNEFPALDNQTEVGPTYAFEYSAREAYGANITWGANDPLNATWWHLVTEQMEYNSTLVQTFNTYQGKSSIVGAPCTGECIPAKICYLRSGSAPISMENCPAGYGSVQ